MYNYIVRLISRGRENHKKGAEAIKGFLNSIILLPPEIITPLGIHLWNEPEITISSIPKSPPSSPSQYPFKTYSRPPSKISETTESFESSYDKSVMCDGEGEEKTLRQ